MKKHKLLANKKNPENAREAVKTVGGKLKSRGGKLVPISSTMINHEKKHDTRRKNKTHVGVGNLIVIKRAVEPQS